MQTNTIIMKKFILLAIIGFGKLSLLAQFPVTKKELFYEVKSIGEKPIKKSTLKNAQKLDDILESYPNSWISNYQSVEISVTNNGKTIKATGKNSILNKEQKDILSSANLYSNMVIDVHYTHKDNITKTEEKNTMHVPMTVYPDMTAEYIDGRESMIKYLKDNTSGNISSKLTATKKEVNLQFYINENGVIENVIIKKSSGDTYIDNSLVELIYKMPKWKPAQNMDGSKVKQNFEFIISGDPNRGC